METVKTNLLLVLGDTHGEWSTLFNYLERINCSDAVICHVGDVGIGFRGIKKLEVGSLQVINDMLAERNIVMYAIRGNHDDPAYFDGSHNLSNLKLLPDYTLMNINGEHFLFVGGAVSIDRKSRTIHKSWWPNEVLVLDESKVEQCDVLITHTAPSWIGPTDKTGIKHYSDIDESLWSECVEERATIDKLINLTKPKKHYCGHFHESALAKNNGCISRIVNIMELVEHNYKVEQHNLWKK